MKPRFIIVANSLKDFRGHYFETSIAIAESARDAGYHPVLGTHVDCPTHMFPDWLDVQPIFTTDHWMSVEPSEPVDLGGLSGDPYADCTVSAEPVLRGEMSVAEFATAHFPQSDSLAPVLTTVPPPTRRMSRLRKLVRTCVWSFVRLLRYILPYFLFLVVGGVLRSVYSGVRSATSWFARVLVPQFVHTTVRGVRRWLSARFAGMRSRRTVSESHTGWLFTLVTLMKRAGYYLLPGVFTFAWRALRAWLRSEIQECKAYVLNPPQSVWTPRRTGLATADAATRALLAEACAAARDVEFLKNIEYGLLFKRDLESLFWLSGIGPDDHVLLGTAHGRELMATYLISRQLTPKRSPHFHLEFRHPLFDGAPTDGQLKTSRRVHEQKFFLDLYDRWGHSPRIRFYTDTVQLSKEYDLLGGMKFDVLPIPFRTHKLQEPNSRAALPLYLTYFGDARDEKGFQWLPELIDQLMDRYVRTGRIRFLLQATPGNPIYNPESTAALERLKRYPAEYVSLIGLDGPLSAETYYTELVNRADIALFPYDRNRYRSASSGTLTEAIASGTPAVVPADSWMSAQLGPGAGETFEDKASFILSVARIVDNYFAHQSAAAIHRHKWLATHTPANLVARIATISSQNTAFAGVESARPVLYVP
jgi:glycosyltransferase involved in cell wall biosynthesis